MHFEKSYEKQKGNMSYHIFMDELKKMYLFYIFGGFYAKQVARILWAVIRVLLYGY